MMRTIAVAFVLCGAAMGAAAQVAEAPQAKPAAPIVYTVVSVRMAKTERANYEARDLPNGLQVRGVTLDALIGEAYGFSVGPLSEHEVEGEPKWAKTTQFDIDAKVDEDDVARLGAEDDQWGDMKTFISAMSTRTPTPRMRMLQALLAERFHLRVHDEMRELPVYCMTIAKSGLRLAKAKDSEHGSLQMAGGEMTAEGAPLSFLPSLLAPEMGRPILDATKLTGTYDFKLKWTPGTQLEGSAATAGGSDSPMLLTALQEQLGLRLEAGKGLVHVTVVDGAVMPGEN